MKINIQKEGEKIMPVVAAAGATDLMTAVGNGMTSVLGWIGTVVDNLIGADGKLNALLPLFAVGIAISAIMLGVKLIRGLIWGA